MVLPAPSLVHTDIPAPLARRGCSDLGFGPLSVHLASSVLSSPHQGTMRANLTHNHQRLLWVHRSENPQGDRVRQAVQHCSWLGEQNLLWRDGPARNRVWWRICTDMLFQPQQFCMIPAAFPDVGKNRPDKQDSKWTLRTLLQNSQLLHFRCENAKVSC